MRRLTLLLTLALPTLLWTACADQAPPLQPDAAHPLAARGGPHVVQVAPPTGDPAADRASVLAALAQVREGGTVQFAPGTYVIGIPAPNTRIEVSVPRVTLLGHPAGTTLRGCEPASITPGACHGLLLSGGHQSVRHLTFTDMGTALLLGRPFGQGDEARVGGYRIEDNTFRNTVNGVITTGLWPQPAVIRGNTFFNHELAVGVLGGRAHVLDNDISAPEPERVPISGAPYAGIYVRDTWFGPCEHNLLASNRIDGYENGALIEVYDPDMGCHHNMIRNNTISNSREFWPSTPAWGIGISDYSGQGGLVSDNLVQGNRILGSEGQGIVIYAGERNRIVNNTVTNVTRTDPFPPDLGEGNGTGVWVSPGSRENQILNNTFAAIASHEVVLEGEYNHVATRSRSDVVRDLGIGNRITGPGSVINFAAPAMRAFSAAPDAAEGGAAARTLRQRLGVDAW